MASSSDFYYYIKLADTSFNKSIVEFIDSREDEKKHTTNVKAKMTEMNLQNESVFQTLKNYMLNFSRFVSKEKYDRNVSFEVAEMWGMSYDSLDYAIPHDHWPATWALTYYINPSKNFPGLYFTDLNEELIIEDGMLVLFPGWVRHEVKRQEFHGKRYVVAANLHLGK